MHLPNKEIKVLEELDINPRASMRSLANKTRQSPQLVEYHINKLKEKGVISQFSTFFNVPGKSNYSIYFEIHASEKIKEEVMREISSFEEVYWAATLGGKWDLLVKICVNQHQDLEIFLDKVFAKWHFVKDYEASIVLENLLFRHKYLGNSVGTIKINLAEKPAVELDKLDFLIMQNIKNNCRLPYVQVARECKVDYRTIKERIEALEAGKIICGYRLLLNAKAFDLQGFIVLLSFKNYGRKVEKSILNYLATEKRVTQASRLFGRWSLELVARASKIEDLQQLLNALKSKYCEIGSMDVIPIFEGILIDTLPN